MAPKQQEKEDEGNMLKLLIDSVEDLDLTSEDGKNPKELIVQDVSSLVLPSPPNLPSFTFFNSPSYLYLYSV